MSVRVGDNDYSASRLADVASELRRASAPTSYLAVVERLYPDADPRWCAGFAEDLQKETARFASFPLKQQLYELALDDDNGVVADAVAKGLTLGLAVADRLSQTRSDNEVDRKGANDDRGLNLYRSEEPPDRLQPLADPERRREDELELGEELELDDDDYDLER